MNVLSLFDGMSCGQIALERAGIKVDNYFASEIDKYAIKVTQKNFPNTIQLGDVTNWREWNLPEIDLIIAGSPCQGFSKAGRQLNFDDPRSILFFSFLNILNYYQPKLWMLENVNMKAEWREVISNLLHTQPVLINSALLSAQNRERLYWANFPITQPEDKGIYLKDIIEDGVVDRDKSYCIDANYHKGGSEKYLKNTYYKKGKRQVVKYQSAKRLMVKVEGAAMRGRYNDEGKAVQVLENNGKEKSNALTTVQKDTLLCIRVGSAEDIKGHDYNKRVYSTEGKSPSLAAKSGGNLEPKVALDDYHYRKLTVLECERLQTVPEGYTSGVSNTQRYRMLGNGWTVDVIAHIFRELNGEKKVSAL